jgi:hypothetical protein
MSPKVHDGSNDDNVLLDSVNQPVWKAARATPAVMLSHPGPSFGMNQNALHRPLNLIQKLQT